MDPLRSPEEQKRIWARVTGAPEKPQEDAPVRSMQETLRLMGQIPGAAHCLATMAADCAGVRAAWYLHTGEAVPAGVTGCRCAGRELLREVILRRQRELEAVERAPWICEGLRRRLVCHGRAHLRFLTERLEGCFRGQS